MAAESVLLTVGPHPLTILVALVAGDHDDRLDRGDVTNRVQQAGRPHGIDGKGLDRRSVRFADEGLSREVKHDRGSRRVHGGFECIDIANVSNRAAREQLADLASVKQRRRAWGRKGVTVNLSA